MHRRMSAWVALLLACAGIGALGEELTVITAPPVVVKADPQAGSTDVDPTQTEIRVTFSKEMTTNSFSVVQTSQESMPKIRGKARYDKDKRTLILPVELESGKTYSMWMNTERFRNCKDSNGRPAVPYLLVFQTKGKAAAAAPAPTRDILAAAFDALCDDMALHYSYFALKGIDWAKLRETYRPRAIAAGSKGEFVGILKELLGQLRDGHVWIISGGAQLGTYIPSTARDTVNRAAILADMKDVKECGEFGVVGRTRRDGFAAIVLTRQSAADSETVRQVVSFIRESRDAPGFLIDLRHANGGNELLAAEIAREFCGKETVYARSKFRNGPAPNDFTQSYERTLKAVDQPFTKPVVCLLGPGCVSSGEGFAKMLACLPHVTTVGTPTRGSSGNPKPFELPGLNIAVWYSRWVDMLPDGTPIEGRGVVPKVLVDAPREAQGDAVWEKAREVLREKIGGSKG